MGLVYTQTGTGATCGTSAACSGETLNGNSPVARQCSIGGTTDDTGLTVAVPAAAGGATVAAMMFETDPIGRTSWEAGDWVVRLNVTSASSASLIVSAVYVCRLNSSCTPLATVGSLTSLTVGLDTTGVKTFTVSGSSLPTTSTSDRAYFVIVTTSSNFFAPESFQFAPNQDIDSPIVPLGSPAGGRRTHLPFLTPIGSKRLGF